MNDLTRNPGWTEQLNHDVSKLIHETRKQYTCITGLSCIQDDEVMRRTSSSNDNSKWAIAWAVETLQRCREKITDLATESERALLSQGYSSERSFVCRVQEPRSLVACYYDVLSCVKKLKQQFTRTYEDIDRYKVQLQQSSFEVETQTKTAEWFKHWTDNLQQKDLCQQKELAELRQEIRRLKLNLHNLNSIPEAEIRCLKACLAERERQVVQTLKEYEDEMRRIERENSNLKTSLEEKERQMKQLYDEKSDLMASFAKKAEEHTEAVEDYRKHMEEAYKKLRLANNKLKQRVNSQRKKNQTECRQKKAAYHKMEKERRNLEIRIEQMLEENTELQSCVSKTEDKLEQTVMELNSLRARLIELQKELDDSTDSIKEREAQITVRTKQTGQLETRNVDLEEQIRRLVDSTKKQDEQIAHMKRKNEELEKLVEKFQIQNTEYEHILRDKDSTMTTLKKERDSLLERNGQLEEQNSENMQTLKRNAEIIQNISKEKEDLLISNSQLEEQTSENMQMLKRNEDTIHNFSKEKEELLTRVEQFKIQNNEYKDREIDAENTLTALKKERDTLLNSNVQLQEQNRENIHTLKRNEETTQTILKEKEELLTRLSEYTSARLLHDNPNVADLSDSYRPTKLAEKFTELYDNEWTDAFEVLTDCSEFREEDAIRRLLEILNSAYTFCSTTSDKQDAMLQETLISPFKADTIKISKEGLDPVQQRNLFDLRKQTSHISLKSVQLGYKEDFRSSHTEYPDSEAFVNYVTQCVELCWYMVLRSPRLYIDRSGSANDLFDKNKYRLYQSSGTKLKFVVWPALYLHEDGPLLSKGVAEAK